MSANPKDIKTTNDDKDKNSKNVKDKNEAERRTSG